MLRSVGWLGGLTGGCDGGLMSVGCLVGGGVGCEGKPMPARLALRGCACEGNPRGVGINKGRMRWLGLLG